jgi:hypothetical protein
LESPDGIATVNGDHHKIAVFENLSQWLELFWWIVEGFGPGEKHGLYVMIGSLEKRRNETGAVGGQPTRHIDQSDFHVST